MKLVVSLFFFGFLSFANEPIEVIARWTDQKSGIQFVVLSGLRTWASAEKECSKLGTAWSLPYQKANSQEEENYWLPKELRARIFDSVIGEKLPLMELHIAQQNPDPTGPYRFEKHLGKAFWSDNYVLFYPEISWSKFHFRLDKPAQVPSEKVVKVITLPSLGEKATMTISMDVATDTSFTIENPKTVSKALPTVCMKPGQR